MEPGTAGILRFSVVASCGDETPLLLGLVAAFSASEGIRKDTGIISWVHWPNVVAIDGKIVATTAAAVTSVADVRWVQLDFRVHLSNDDLKDSTSLSRLLGVELDANLLFEKVLESLSWMHFGWANGMQAQIIRRVKSMTETIGTDVSAQKGGKRVAGSAADIDPLGRLVVRLAGGEKVRLEAGDELLQS
jgi:biotin-(acetyl-CoA carboxylase) ligase